MEYTTLNNGVQMPMAGIGTFLLSPDEAEASVRSALQCGYRLIDTANAYMNEKAVGRAIRSSGLPRQEIFLETKLWPSSNLCSLFKKSVCRDGLRRPCTASWRD